MSLLPLKQRFNGVLKRVSEFYVAKILYFIMLYCVLFSDTPLNITEIKC